MPHYFFETPEQQQADSIAAAGAGDVLWSDYAKTLGAGFADVAAAPVAAARWAGESLLPEDSMAGRLLPLRTQHLEGQINQAGADLRESRSSTAQLRALATIGSSDFLSHPISSLALKATETAPSVAASIGATLFTPGGIPARIALLGINGGLSAGETINDMYASVDHMTPEELARTSSIYRGYRKDGLSDTQARKELNRAMIGYKPFGLFALGVATGEYGPAGQLAGALGRTGKKAAEGGFLSRTGRAAFEGGSTEFAQTGAEQFSQEQGAVDIGLQPAVRWGNVGSAAVEGGLIGAVLGLPGGLRGAPASQRPPAHDTTTAGERAHPDNPSRSGVDYGETYGPFRPSPGVDYGEKYGPPRLPPVTADYGEQYGPFQPGPPSMPTREGDTQGSPPIAGSTPPPVPGGRPPRRSSKKGAVPTTPTTENAPTVTGEARIVIDDAQVTALDATKSPAQKTAQKLLPIVTAPFPAPSPGAGTMPAPGPQTNVAPATPAEDMGAGTIQAKVGDLVNIEIGGAIANPTPVRVRNVTPDGFVLVEGSNTGVPIQQVSVVTPAPVTEAVPIRGRPKKAPVQQAVDTESSFMTPSPEPIATVGGRRVMETMASPTAQTVVAEALNRAEANLQARAKRGATGEEKDTTRAAKRTSDALTAQGLLSERPGEFLVPETSGELSDFHGMLQNIVQRAKDMGVKLREKVGYENTPDSLVWLRSAQQLSDLLANPDVEAKAKLKAVTGFLEAENDLINTNSAARFRDLRKQESEERTRKPAATAAAVENIQEEGGAPVAKATSSKPSRPRSLFDTRRKASPEKLTPERKAELIVEETEKRKPLTKKAAAAKEKFLAAARKEKATAEKKASTKLKKQSEAQAKKVEEAKKEAKALAKAGAESDEQARIRLALEAAERKAAEAEEAARKEAEEEAKKPESKKKKLTQNEKALKVREIARVRTEKKAAAEAKKQAEAEAKAEEKAIAAKKTTPKTQKALAAIQTAERVKARKQAEKQARSQEAAAKRTPFATLKAQTRKAKEAAARAFKPVVRTKLEIARSLAKKITGFVTAKGSTYTVDAEGKTTRTKAARKDIGHEGDEGLKAKSEKTVYVSKRNASALAQPQGANWRFVDHGDGTFSLITKNRDGQWGVSPDQHKIPVTTEPAVGSIPLELWKGETIKGLPAYGRAHFGNQIVSVTKGRPTLTLPTLQALSSPQVKERLFGKKKLQAEKKKVEEAHSTAKHEADNFTKGHVSIEGVPVSIETKAGFGSIPGTVDTNGKPVKVLLGEEAVPGNKSVRDLQVVVIDQVDPSTGALTNHVVLYGFDDIQAAVNEFDGNFPDQMGDFAVMSHDELQAWIKSKENAEPVGVIPDEPASMDNPPPIEIKTPQELRMENDIEAANIRADKLRSFLETYSTRPGKLFAYIDASLRQLRGGLFPEFTIQNRMIFPELAKKIKRIAGDTPVHVLPDAIYFKGRPANSNGYYSNTLDVIIIPERTFNSLDKLPRIILHEGVHAAFTKALYSNPKAIKQLKQILLEATKSATIRHYGLTNIDELLAEVLTKPEFRDYMARTKASPELIAELGLTAKLHSLWDAFVRLVGEVLGLGPVHDSLLSATLKIMDNLEFDAIARGRGPLSPGQRANLLRRHAPGVYGEDFEPASMDLLSIVTDRIPERFRPAPGQEQMSNPRLLWLRSLDGLAQMSKMFGRPFYNHVRAIADTLGRIDASAKEYLKKWLPTIDESLQLEREYKRTEVGTVHWDNYQNVMHDERSAGAWAHLPLADQPGTVKDPLRGAYARARMPDLYARWSALPDDLKTLRMKTLNFYAARQNEANERNLRNIMRAAGHTDPALMHRIFNGTETEADKALLGPIYDHITDNEQLSKINGPYYPFKRRGDHVVRALYKITAPRRFLREIPNEDGSVNTWEFGGPGLTTEDAEKMAADYAATQTDLYPTVTSLWVNEATGENTYTDASGEEQRVKASDPDSVKRFRVSVENRYVEFFDKKEALRVAKDLENHPDVIPDSVKEVVEQRFIPQDRQMDLASYKMQALADTIKKRASFKNLPPHEQAEVEGVLMEASLRILPHTRIQTRHLPFNHIQGASKDSTRAMMEHAESLSGFMSRLDHQQDLNEAIAGMMKETDSNDGKSLARSHIANHVLQRINYAAANPPSSFTDGVVKRILITSFLARLVSPATSMVNMMQPITTTLPMLASRHGPGRSSREMLRVYKQIGTGRSLKTGIAATGRALRYGAGAEHPTLIEDMMVGMSANQKRMVKELIARNIIDPDVGIEVSLLSERASIGGYLDRMLNYLQRFGRQMPRTIEAINRVVTATAAYNLELEKSGGNHDVAVNFAAEITSATQGVYSRTNAAPVFNHPLGKISFQFKQYAQLIYELIGSQVEKAYRNAEPGDRAEALKALGFMAISYTTVAGTMGLPTEPIKLLLMAAAPLGLPYKWEDFENDEREFMASIFGKYIGEIITHGISRALPEGFAFDLSSRVGIQDLLLFGEPRSQDQQDVKAYLWDVVAGAPGALVRDWFLGTQDLLSGDVIGAAEKLNPVKVGADLVKSYRMATEGKKTGAGYPSLSPYSLSEAAIRTFGFTPARESEAGEASRYFYAKQAEAQGARGSFMHQWAAASGSERGKLWGQIERYNSSREDDEKLTRADLDRYVRSRATIEKSRRSGLRLTRREKSLYKDITGVYNIQ